MVTQINNVSVNFATRSEVLNTIQKKCKIGYLSTAYHTSFILMGSDWVRERIGRKVEWLLFPTGPEMVKAFAKRELDIGYIGLPPAMIGIDKGLQIKCVAGGHMEGTVLTAKKTFKTLTELGGIKETLNQFKGKAIGTPSRGSIHDVIIRTLIDEAGLKQDVAIKNFEWADFILESMEDCMVDGAAGTPPLAVLASRFLDAKVVLPAHMMWPHNPSYGIVTTMEMIKSSSDILEEFLKLHEKACDLIRSRPEEAAEIVAKTMGVVDKDFVLETYRVSPKYCASLSKEYIDSTMAFVPVLQKMGYISKTLVKDDVFYTRLIERIHPEQAHYDDPDMLG